jgi:hypothetical protein
MPYAPKPVLTEVRALLKPSRAARAEPMWPVLLAAALFAAAALALAAASILAPPAQLQPVPATTLRGAD